MPLDPEAQRIIDRTPAEDPNASGPLDVIAIREGFKQMFVMPDDLPEVGSVADTTIPGPAGELPVRVYTPEGEGPFPAFVWFHGGGWTVGGLDENEYSCRAVCAAADTVVISVDYRLAPENPFPAAADDAYAAVSWVAAHGAEIGADPARIAVGGESAGGNLAAVAALKARDLGGPRIALQVLVSPVLGHPDDGRPSYSLYSEGYFLSKSSMDWFFTTYPKSPADLDDPYLLPLRSDDLSGVAPALVLGAEYDVLRDEGEEYAARLKEAGVDTELVRYDGIIHAFFGPLATELSAGRKAQAKAAAALRAAFGTDGER
ncbi:alpha/beta hydrolase [Actinomadura spongiicola]|uniref:Alpha/beta hydrolase n=1 Tax=Actinomadura spongiicola TaxID=2303421 RepID=A0A372GAZ7_9ACTN|nr:alpha/beta hydrolase [Actinomadura spongiicola]RFS82517.1 alpha/beta hydrolase [Actinomadura spongiicola]